MNYEEWKDDYSISYEPNYTSDLDYDCQSAFAAGVRHAVSQIAVTSDEDGNVVLVSRTDEEHRILEIIWEK